MSQVLCSSLAGLKGRGLGWPQDNPCPLSDQVVWGQCWGDGPSTKDTRALPAQRRLFLDIRSLFLVGTTQALEPAVPNCQVTLMASATDGRSWALRLAISRRRVLSLRGRASLWSWGTLNLAAIHSTAATQYTEAWGREKPAVLSGRVSVPTEPSLSGPRRHLEAPSPQVRV